jgi:hypothetical protein
MASELETSRVFSCPMNKSRPREATSDHISIYLYSNSVKMQLGYHGETSFTIFQLHGPQTPSRTLVKFLKESKYEGLNLWLYDFKT